MFKHGFILICCIPLLLEARETRGCAVRGAERIPGGEFDAADARISCSITDKIHAPALRREVARRPVRRPNFETSIEPDETTGWRPAPLNESRAICSPVVAGLVRQILARFCRNVRLPLAFTNPKLRLEGSWT